MKKIICYYEYNYLPIENTGVNITDLLVQRGYGIFDFLRVEKNTPLFLDDHLDRLFHSAGKMRLEITESRDEIIQIVHELISKNKLEHSGIRLVVSGGDSEDGYTITKPRLMVIQQAIAMPPEDLSNQEFRLVSYPFQRQLAEVKTTDYLMAIWLHPWMKNKGAHDILYHQNEFIRECPRSNFFLVTKNDTLVTPATNMLKGITRKNVLKVAKANNIAVEERDIHLDEIKDAKEAFISSSTKRITPVSQVDNIKFPAENKASLTHTLFQLLKEKELAYINRHQTKNV